VIGHYRNGPPPKLAGCLPHSTRPSPASLGPARRRLRTQLGPPIWPSCHLGPFLRRPRSSRPSGQAEIPRHRHHPPQLSGRKGQKTPSTLHPALGPQGTRASRQKRAIIHLPASPLPSAPRFFGMEKGGRRPGGAGLFAESTRPQKVNLPISPATFHANQPRRTTFPPPALIGRRTSSTAKPTSNLDSRPTFLVGRARHGNMKTTARWRRISASKIDGKRDGGQPPAPALRQSPRPSEINGYPPPSPKDRFRPCRPAASPPSVQLAQTRRPKTRSAPAGTLNGTGAMMAPPRDAHFFPQTSSRPPKVAPASLSTPARFGNIAQRHQQHHRAKQNRPAPSAELTFINEMRALRLPTSAREKNTSTSWMGVSGKPAPSAAVLVTTVPESPPQFRGKGHPPKAGVSPTSPATFRNLPALWLTHPLGSRPFKTASPHRHP